MGIDGGGSHTTAWVANAQGEILGKGRAGASNYQSVGEAAAQNAILQVIQRTFKRAGLPPQQLDSLCLGLAGFGRDDEKRSIRRWAESAGLSRQVLVVNDADLLLWAATPEGWGLGVACGTGSIAMGKTPGGRSARAGGWGYLIGDEGSGYAIGLAALRAAVQAADLRIPPTRLMADALEALGLVHVEQLVKFLYQDTPSREKIASLAEVVFAAAEQGDRQASLILEEAVAELGSAALAVCRQLEWRGPVPCALGGGVFIHHPELADRVTSRIQEGGVKLEPISVVPEPAAGAVRLALRNLVAKPEEANQ